MGCADGRQGRYPLPFPPRSRRKCVSRKRNSMPQDTAGARAACTQQAVRGARVMAFRGGDPDGVQGQMRKALEAEEEFGQYPEALETILGCRVLFGEWRQVPHMGRLEGDHWRQEYHAWDCDHPAATQVLRAVAEEREIWGTPMEPLPQSGVSGKAFLNRGHQY